MTRTHRPDERKLMSFVVLIQRALQASLPMQYASDCEQASVYTCCRGFKVGLVHVFQVGMNQTRIQCTLCDRRVNVCIPGNTCP